MQLCIYRGWHASHRKIAITFDRNNIFWWGKKQYLCHREGSLLQLWPGRLPAPRSIKSKTARVGWSGHSCSHRGKRFWLKRGVGVAIVSIVFVKCQRKLNKSDKIANYQNLRFLHVQISGARAVRILHQIIVIVCKQIALVGIKKHVKFQDQRTKDLYTVTLQSWLKSPMFHTCKL